MLLVDVIDKNGSIILLSIYEVYFDSIISGEKRYEYRKRYRKEETQALIYISKTKKRIVGLVEFGEPIVGDSHFISNFAAKNGDSSYQEMKVYLGTNENCYAIPVKKVYLLENPLTPLELAENSIPFTAPQSYSILKKDCELLKFMIKKGAKLREVTIDEQ